MPFALGHAVHWHSCRNTPRLMEWHHTIGVVTTLKGHSTFYGDLGRVWKTHLQTSLSCAAFGRGFCLFFIYGRAGRWFGLIRCGFWFYTTVPSLSRLIPRITL